MSRDFERLLADFLDDRLDQQGLAALAEAVRAEPAAAAEFQALVWLDLVLRVQHAGPSLEATARDAVLARIAGQKPAGAQSRRTVLAVARKLARVPRRRLLAWTACAAALLVAGTLVWLMRHDGRGRVVEAHGAVLCRRAGDWWRPSIGTRIEGTLAWRLPGDGALTFGWPDGTTLRLEGPGAGGVDWTGPIRRAIVDHGRLQATVAPQIPPYSFVAETPQLLATVVGTRFIMQVDPLGSRVRVEEGRVWVEPRPTGAAVCLTAGQDISIAAATPDSASSTITTVRPANPRLSSGGRAVLSYLATEYGRRTLAGYNAYVHTPDDYQQTGRTGAIRARDMQWLDLKAALADWTEERCIPSLHWHWSLGGDSAWTAKRETPVDLGKVVTPGSPEHRQAMDELAAMADKLEVLRDAGAPVLWRPLHGIDGGWFWWTDRFRPENTAAFWRLLFDYLTETRGLDNLIWVYSVGEGSQGFEERRRFYPGDAYVDIAGVGLYQIDPGADLEATRAWYELLGRLCPGKMRALCECRLPPVPAAGAPVWLYALPWFGPGTGQLPVSRARAWMQHPSVITLDALPPFGANAAPLQVGILDPVDDGSAWSAGDPPEIRAYANARGGQVARVEFYADRTLIGTDETAPYACVWQDATPGTYDLTAVTVDGMGRSAVSNRVRLATGMVDLARGRPVTASSQVYAAEQAVDGDYYSSWVSDNGDPTPDDEWIRVDLGGVHTIDRVNLLWGWKVHASDLCIDVAIDDPDLPASWTTVHAARDLPYVTWKATHRFRFPPVAARHVRLHALRRAAHQTWGGYCLSALEVPVIASRPPAP